MNCTNCFNPADECDDGGRCPACQSRKRRALALARLAHAEGRPVGPVLMAVMDPDAPVILKFPVTKL